MRKRVLLAVFTLLIVLACVIAWTLAGLPPPGMVLRYGLNPYCEPTGARETYEGVEFVEIGPGIFRMGSTKDAENGDLLGRICAPLGMPWGRQPMDTGEMPVRWVEFRRGFWIATTEITNPQYERFDEEYERSEHSKRDDDPAVDVSWVDANRYCAWLAEKANRPVRLPSEAEWECACRAGGTGEFTFGDDEAQLSEYAWFGQDQPGDVRPVPPKRPNRWGLYHLHGNVWEWCEDMYHHTYRDAPSDGSARTKVGVVMRGSPVRVIRGGSYIDPAESCRSASRGWLPLGDRSWDVGFRPVFVRSED